MMFAYHTLANSWYDFRDDPTNDAMFTLAQSFIQLTYYGAAVAEDEDLGVSESRWWPGRAPGASYYGDIDATAMSPLHAVIARDESTALGAQNPTVYLWSPDAYLAQ